MRVTIHSRLARLILGGALALGLAGAGTAQEAPRAITVTGTGEVEAAPDLAEITAGVVTEAETAAEALAANGRAMTEVLAAVADAGIAPADVQTRALNLEPVWDASGGPQVPGEDAPRITGYRASNQVSLRLRAIDTLGPVIDALGEAGANQLFGIVFSLAEPKAQRDDALRAAVADARAKAELLAEAAGATLGPVLSIRAGSAPGRPIPYAARAEMAMDMGIAEGSVAVGAEVEVVFELE